MYSDVGDAMWWGFVTMTTVGYGDRFPKTQGGRVVGVVLMFAGIILISSFTATASSVLVARRIQEQQRERPLDWSSHIIFCGWNEMAPRILRVLDTQSASTRQVVLLNERTEEAMELQTRGYEHLEIRFVRGNFIREEDLNRANIRQAATAIIVPDATDGRQPDEQKTFEATTMIKDIAPDVKVFAHVLEAERVANLRRAMVDDVVVTNEYVGELIAGFVTKPGVTQAIRTLVSLEGETELTVVPIDEAFHGRPIGDFADHLRTQARTILIGIVAEEEGFGLEAAMRGGDQYIVELIREEIAKAGIKTHTQGSKTRVTLNPENDRVIQTAEMALVIRNKTTTA
jgi:voltage-gated potassium channel